jgi:hypothetical protein
VGPLDLYDFSPQGRQLHAEKRTGQPGGQIDNPNAFQVLLKDLLQGNIPFQLRFIRLDYIDLEPEFEA